MDTKIEYKNGLPSRVIAGNSVLGENWGAETSDRHSFFTLTGNSVNCRVLSDKSYKKNGVIIRELIVEMVQGTFLLRHEVQQEEGIIFRRQKLVCITDSVFQDYVTRYKFNKSLFANAEIAGHSFVHRGSNIWNQFKTKSAKLHGEDFNVRINVTNCETEGKFRQEMYVRDEPGDSWIVHGRLIPDPPEKLWIRWDTRYGRIIDISGRTASLILRNNLLRRYLWHLAERKGGRPNIQAQGLAFLPEGSTISLDTEAIIEKNYK